MGNKTEKLGAKPEGVKGIIAGKLMNVIHSRLYGRIIRKHIIGKNTGYDAVLDIGCGGGIAVKAFSGFSQIGKICGIDYSEDMVRLSTRVNKKQIEAGRVEILQADVSALPFKDGMFDIVTAFDTVNFWPDHDKALSQVKRVLKPGGVFYIINAYPKEGTRWHDFVKFKNDAAYKEFLSTIGFINPEAIFEKSTIIVSGRR